MKKNKHIALTMVLMLLFGWVCVKIWCDPCPTCPDPDVAYRLGKSQGMVDTVYVYIYGAELNEDFRNIIVDSIRVKEFRFGNKNIWFDNQ